MKLSETQLATILNLAASLIVAASGVTCGTGCRSDDVARAFGYTEPGIHAKWNELIGTGEFDISSDFAGTADVAVSTNGTMHANVTVNSNASVVTQAQADRITENFLEGRRIEWDGKARQAELVGQNISAFWNGAISFVSVVGKEVGVPIVSKVAEALGGSGGAFTIDGVGGASFNLGGSCPNTTATTVTSSGGG